MPTLKVKGIASLTERRILPTQSQYPELNSFTFNTADCEDVPRPVGWLPASKWPPHSADALLKANIKDGPCVGRRYWEQDYCDNKFFTCGHTLEEWVQGTENWEELFELCMTKDRGTGVFAKTAWGNGDILTGVLKLDGNDSIDPVEQGN